MKNETQILLSLLGLLIIISITRCKKDALNTNSLYIPDSTNVTATTSLKDLQDGRTLFIDNCGQCHNYYSPESYSPAQWDDILLSMGPKTGMSPAQVELVKKYVKKGK
jgi:hypothetical protein